MIVNEDELTGMKIHRDEIDNRMRYKSLFNGEIADNNLPWVHYLGVMRVLRNC